MRSFQLPGRSTAHGTNGMCASSSPAASLVALDILRAGGNAIDAAVAASAVILITEPHMTGIGGDCFALIGRADGSVTGINASGRAAEAADEDWLRSMDWSEVPGDSVHTVTVPGAVDGWDRLLKDHGTMDFAQTFAPAIALGEAGTPTMPRVASDWAGHADRLAADEGGRLHYLKDGRSPRVGEMMSHPALARSLRLIAEGGRDVFYSGEIAENLVAHLQSLGSLLTLDDFAKTKADYVELISTDFLGHEMMEIPPTGQGITALIMLNILKRFDVSAHAPGSVERHHLQIEAARLAYELRHRHVADPGFADVPVGHMLSDALADELAARIDMGRAIPDIPAAVGPRYANTIYLTVVDKDRTAVSFINSIYNLFGVGIACPKTAIMLHNRGSCFTAEPGHPNCIGPGKRPMHTIIPGMLRREGAVVMPFGVMGADYQPMGHVQVLVNMLAYGMDIQEAIDFPRFFPDPYSGVVGLEEGVSERVASGLTALGHGVVAAGAPWGGGQGIVIDWDEGTLTGGSDPRKDGIALGY
ncbi:MAG: gamma-glutamyltransferase family protein [Hyphomicrobiales bacterium]